MIWDSTESLEALEQTGQDFQILSPLSLFKQRVQIRCQWNHQPLQKESAEPYFLNLLDKNQIRIGQKQWIYEDGRLVKKRLYWSSRDGDFCWTDDPADLDARFYLVSTGDVEYPFAFRSVQGQKFIVVINDKLDFGYLGHLNERSFFNIRRNS